MPGRRSAIGVTRGRLTRRWSGRPGDWPIPAERCVRAAAQRRVVRANKMVAASPIELYRMILPGPRDSSLRNRSCWPSSARSLSRWSTSEAPLFPGWAPSRSSTCCSESKTSRPSKPDPDLAAADYEYVRRYETEFPERRLFAKPQQRPRAYHLHAVEFSTAFWRRQLFSFGTSCAFKRRSHWTTASSRGVWPPSTAPTETATHGRRQRSLKPFLNALDGNCEHPNEPTRAAEPNRQREPAGSGPRG